MTTAETLTAPDEEAAASVDETELVLRWMEKPGTRLVELDGTLACPAPGTGAYSAFLARVDGGRAQRDPFADGRSLRTRDRPDRVPAGAGGARRTR
jgi:DNA polymerase-3 subunit epsilon